MVNVIGVRHEAWLVGVAVSAHCDVRALDSVVVTSSSVDRAGFVCHVGVMHELEGG